MASAQHSLRDHDWPLLVLTLIICSMGVLQIYSATHDTIWRDAWWKQIIWITLGLVLFFVISRMDYHRFVSHAYWLWGLSVIGLVFVFLIGARVYGSRRWIPLGGGFRFQISEFVKIVIILVVTRFLTDLKKDELDWRNLLKLGVLVGVPTVLVMKQPDLGTSLTYIPVLLTGVYLYGLRWHYWVVLLLSAALALPIGWHFLKDYQKARLITFLDPTQDPQGNGYQVIQSKIAVGAGGMWGKGVTRGTQTQLQFLPVPHTDFIFSAFAEEHGFVGVVVVLGLYLLLLMQLVQNAQTAADSTGMYLCMGVCALLLFHVLVNVGMVVGRMPVTGIPLPLMSAGGSNILMMFIALGLVNSVRLQRYMN